MLRKKMGAEAILCWKTAVTLSFHVSNDKSIDIAIQKEKEWNSAKKLKDPMFTSGACPNQEEKTSWNPGVWAVSMHLLVSGVVPRSARVWDAKFTRYTFVGQKQLPAAWFRHQTPRRRPHWNALTPEPHCCTCHCVGWDSIRHKPRLSPAFFCSVLTRMHCKVRPVHKCAMPSFPWRKILKFQVEL